MATLIDLGARITGVAKKKNWIKQGDKHPGLFKAKAERAGMSTEGYAEKEKGAPGKLGKEARFALNAMHAGRRAKLYDKKKMGAE